MLSDADLQAIGLTLRLASTVTVLLLLVGTPLAWWLARTRSWLKAPIGAVVALPLVLPPTVLGFYLLVAMGPNGPLGQLTQAFGLGSLAFSFWGLVVGSIFYSLPFVVQPIQNAIEALGERPLEVAATLGAGPIDRIGRRGVRGILVGVVRDVGEQLLDQVGAGGAIGHHRDRESGVAFQ